jgi:hypothetical protein
VVLPPYVTCLRLVAVADQHWEAIDGDLAHQGIDPFDLNPQRFFNLLYYWMLARAKDPDQFEMRLNEPAPGKPGGRVSESERQRDAESFLAFAGAFGVTPGALG